MASSETEWGRMQQLGMQQYIVRGALRHGVPMAVIVVGVIEILSGNTLDRARITSGDFLERALLCLAVFSASGAISSYARWRAAAARFGERGGPL